jgi:phage replication-related protein YjqB (UPF0714/DUF867 family)
MNQGGFVRSTSGNWEEIPNMADKYKNFEELAANEQEGSDFQVRFRARCGTAAVIAPHGGGIEPGTSEVADAIANLDLSFYAFEGIKKAANGILHITSGRFNEPQGVALVAVSPAVVALHGEDSGDPVVFLGGLDQELGARIQVSLQGEGFMVGTHENPNLQGRDKNNICNRGESGRGVQLELSNGLRALFFRTLARNGRQHPTEQFGRFVNAVRRGILPAL